MKIAIFIDGKNFYAGWKESGGEKLDFQKMTKWIIDQCGGSELFAVYYYTGIEVGSNSETEQQEKLNSFLDMLEIQSGFFVRRFPRRQQQFDCADCGQVNFFTQEKEVDTSMVADMMFYAAINAFDRCVLISGDSDYCPAIEGVQRLAKQVAVASWGGSGLSNKIRKAAFCHINLNRGSSFFNYNTKAQPNNIEEDIPEVDEQTMFEHFVEEVSKAQEKFGSGYVGVNYFVTRWSSNQIPQSAAERRNIIDQLVENDLVEIYDTPDGKKAIRVDYPTENENEEFKDDEEF